MPYLLLILQKPNIVAFHVVNVKRLQNISMLRNILRPRNVFGIQISLLWSRHSIVTLCFLSLYYTVFGEKLKRSGIEVYRRKKYDKFMSRQEINFRVLHELNYRSVKLQ